VAERPSARMSGTRLYWTLGLVGLLAVLTVAVVLVYDDDSDDGEPGGSADTTVATLPTTPDDGSLPDDVIATVLLPPIGAFGPEWIETRRDDEPEVVEALAEGECPPGPVPEGHLIRGEQQHTSGQTIVEALAITAGVVAEGVESLSLDDELIVSCLLDGLRDQLPDTSTAEVAPDAAVGPTPPGALVSHVRFVVTGADGSGGTFDFVLVRRGRLVSLGLLTGTGAVESTPVSVVAAALDAPLQAALPRVD